MKQNCQDNVSTGQPMKPFNPCIPKPTGNYVINDFEPNALLITNGAGQVITKVSNYFIDPNDGSIHIVGDLHVQTLYYDNLNPPVSGGGIFTHRIEPPSQTYQNNALIGLAPEKVKAFSAGMELMTSPDASFDDITGTVDFGYLPSDYIDIWAITS